MVLSIVCYSLGTALCGLSTDVTQLLVCRFILGLGNGGEWSAGAALITETFPAEHRGKVMAWVQSAFAVGLLPALFAFWVRRHTRESEIWLKQKTRLSLGATIGALFGEHRRNTLVGLAFTAAAMCGYWGLFTWIPAYLSAPIGEGGAGFDMLRSTAWIVVMQVGAAIGFISFGYIADRLGRRNAFLLFFICSALAVPMYVAIRSPVLLLAFGPVVAFFGTGFYSGFAPTFAELFPTNVRATAQGFIYNTGRAASALALALIGLMSRHANAGIALGTTAGFFALAALIVFFCLRETRVEKLN